MKIDVFETPLHPVRFIMGISLCAVGVFLLGVAFEKDLENPLANVIVFWFGVFTSGFGIGIAFHIEKFYFDAIERVIKHSHGVLFYIHSKKYSFDSIKRVEGRKQVSHKVQVGNVLTEFYHYKAYLVFNDRSVELFCNSDREYFTQKVEEVRRVINSPVVLRIEKVVSGEPHEPKVGILRVTLSILFVFLVSALLLKYVW